MNKKCIGIIEMHYHEELLSTMIKLFQDDDISIYMSRDVYNNLSDESKDKATFIFKEKNDVKSIKEFANSGIFDYLFVNTIQPSMVDIPIYKNIEPKSKSILTLHNLNAWCNKKFIGRKKLLHSIDSYVASKYTDRIINKFDALNVVYQPMIKEAIARFNKPIINIPYALAKTKIKQEKKNTVDFVIPGPVLESKRDYVTVLDAFHKLLMEHKNFRLILLGKYHKVKDFEFEHFKQIVTFKEFVPKEVYDDYLSNADFILIPSLQNCHAINMVDESYGYTKIPTIPEAIRNRKPLIVPDYIPVDSRLESSTLKYHSVTSLYDIIDNNIDSINKLNKESIENTKHWLPSNVRKDVIKQLEKL